MGWPTFVMVADAPSSSQPIVTVRDDLSHGIGVAVAATCGGIGTTAESAAPIGAEAGAGAPCTRPRPIPPKSRAEATNKMTPKAIPTFVELLMDEDSSLDPPYGGVDLSVHANQRDEHKKRPRVE